MDRNALISLLLEEFAGNVVVPVDEVVHNVVRLSFDC